MRIEIPDPAITEILKVEDSNKNEYHQVKNLAKKYDLESVPSFKDNTNEFHRTFAKQFQLYIENGKKLKNTRKNLG